MNVNGMAMFSQDYKEKNKGPKKTKNAKYKTRQRQKMKTTSRKKQKGFHGSMEPMTRVTVALWRNKNLP